MKIFLFFILATFISSCASKDGVYWCGDHPCINKAEKEAYFKKTMIVDFREFKKNDKDEQSKLNKILEEAKKNEKKRISDERVLKKEAKIKSKKLKKEKKAKLKKKKLNKKKELKSEEVAKKSEDVEKVKIVKNDQVDISEFSNNKFEDIVKKINDRNANKPFPDINNTPN